MNTPSRHPIFLQKINQTSIQNRSTFNQKSIENPLNIELGKYVLFEFSPFSVNLNNNAFSMPNLPPFWNHVGSPNLKKSLNMPSQDASIFCLHFGIDFYAIWAPSWDPSCGHVGLLWPTKRTQDPPKKQNKRSWASGRSQDRFLN